MSLVAKVFVVFNLIASVAFLVFAMNVWTANTKWQKMYEQEKSKNIEFLAKTQKRERDLAAQIVYEQGVNDRQNRENTTLKLSRNEIRDAKLQVESELATIKNQLSIKEAENQEFVRENKRYFDEIVKQKGVIVKQQQAVIVERENAVRARYEKSEIESEYNVAKQALAALQRDKRGIEEDLALQTRRIERLLQAGVPVASFLNEDPSATQPYIPDAQVLAVRPDIGLVMISCGSQQQVKRGFQFTISRGDQYVGKVQVENVYPDMCSARILPGMTKSEIQIHDEAKSR